MLLLTNANLDNLTLILTVMCEPLEKRPRLDNCDIFDHLSDEDSCVSDESCYTWQGYETGNTISSKSRVSIVLRF